MEYKPHFALEARRREPHLHCTPLDLCQRCLCWSRRLDELCVLLRLVAKATPGEEDEQQRTDAEYDDIHPLPAPVDKGLCPSTDRELRGDEQDNHTTGCIAKPMGECREQHTSPRMIENPGVEKREGNRDEEETRVVGKAERSEYERKEHGQMPQAMQRTEDEGPQDGAVALLQPRQRKATP